jgi:hypothetical protein
MSNRLLSVINGLADLADFEAGNNRLDTTCSAQEGERRENMDNLTKAKLNEFFEAVQRMFECDADWSINDLGSAREAFALTGFVPSDGAVYPEDPAIVEWSARAEVEA